MNSIAQESVNVYPRRKPSESPLNACLDLAAFQEQAHTERAEAYRRLADYHEGKAAEARSVRYQAERLVFGGAS